MSQARKQIEELAKKRGVSLAPSRPVAAAAANDDPFALVRDVMPFGVTIHPSPGEAVTWPGATPHYMLSLKPLPDDAPEPPRLGRGWLRDRMPAAAQLFDSLRTWVPPEGVRLITDNLWAGQGFVVDEAAGLALGAPPGHQWVILGVEDSGIKRVRARRY